MKRIHYTDNYIINPTHSISIALVGVGGTGSQMLTNLARIDQGLLGLGHPGLHVTAYDPDEVTEANIGRQLFSPADLGLNKANVLITRINRFFGSAWQAVPGKFGADKERHNITISCVDSIKSRLDIAKKLKQPNGYAYQKKLYWMDFGNTVNTGQVVLGTLQDIEQPTMPGVEPVAVLKCMPEVYDLKTVDEKESGPSCSLADALSKQDMFINSTLAQLGGAMLWKLISTGSIDYSGLYLNLDTMKVNPIKL